MHVEEYLPTLVYSLNYNHLYEYLPTYLCLLYLCIVQPVTPFIHASGMSLVPDTAQIRRILHSFDTQSRARAKTLPPQASCIPPCSNPLTKQPSSPIYTQADRYASVHRIPVCSQV